MTDRAETVTPAGLRVAQWQDVDGVRIDTAHAYGTPVRADVAQYLDPSTGRRTATVSVFAADGLDRPRAWRLGSGSVVASLTNGYDDVDLYADDPRALAAVLRAAADALDVVDEPTPAPFTVEPGWSALALDEVTA